VAQEGPVPTKTYSYTEELIVVPVDLEDWLHAAIVPGEQFAVQIGAIFTDERAVSDEAVRSNFDSAVEASFVLGVLPQDVGEVLFNRLRDGEFRRLEGGLFDQKVGLV